LGPRTARSRETRSWSGSTAAAWICASAIKLDGQGG
jgi:hypothetical protein